MMQNLTCFHYPHILYRIEEKKSICTRKKSEKNAPIFRIFPASPIKKRAKDEKKRLQLPKVCV
jgi:hypothetical protein